MSFHSPSFRSCFGMIPEFYYADFPRQFRLRKRERSSSYVTDDEDENGRKGHVRKERNHSKTASYSPQRHAKCGSESLTFRYTSRINPDYTESDIRIAFLRPSGST